MFTLPPRPPKDYILREVTSNQATTSQLTPSAYPRATQTSIALYCSPVPADDNEPADLTAIEKLNDRVLDLWTKEARATWVDKPGANAYFLDSVCRKYSVVVDPDYDPRYKNRPRVFQRSYKYEFDCIEEARVEKLVRKLEREEKILNEQKQMLLSKKEDKEKAPCSKVPPFWWKEPDVSDEKDTTDACKKWRETRLKPVDSTYHDSYTRWIEEPKIIGAGEGDGNKRKEDLAQVGIPFKHEACVWYYENYPPPKIKFIPVRFAK